MSKTKVFNTEYKGSPVLSIKEVNEDGDPNPDAYSVVSFGMKKAKAIIEHFEDIKKFVEENK